MGKTRAQMQHSLSIFFVRRIFYDCAKESGPPRNCKLRTQVARGGGDCVVQYVARVLCKATLSRHHQRRSQPWLATLSRAAGARWARSRTSCATRRSDSVLQRLRKDAEALGAPIAAARGTLCAYSNHGTVTRCGRRLRPPIPCQPGHERDVAARGLPERGSSIRYKVKAAAIGRIDVGGRCACEQSFS